MADADVRIVVVTYNTRELAGPLLGDLRRELSGRPGSEVVVIDNASTDGSADAVAADFPEFELRRFDTNVGFARAVNAGAQGARTRWLLLVNPDARVDEGAIGRLLDAAAAKPAHGLYGGRFVDVRRGTNEDSVAVLPSLANLASFATGLAPILRRLGWRAGPARLANSAVDVEVDALPGTFLLAETEAWQEIGGFDERFFMYAEDLDLCVRMAATGRRPLYVPAAGIRHIGGASSTSGRKEVLQLTSLTTFVRTHWSPAAAAAGCRLLMIGVGLRRTARLPFRTPEGRWETAWRERNRWLAGW
jgi:N-acetylglucosaminyl-diphospho-decaprenol L-rhamnosyltransferase